MSVESFTIIPLGGGEIHNCNIIHCYALRLNKKGAIILYVSFAPLTVPQIMKLLNSPGESTRLKVVISSTRRNDLDLFKNVVSRRIMGSNLSRNMQVKKVK